MRKPRCVSNKELRSAEISVVLTTRLNTQLSPNAYHASRAQSRRPIPPHQPMLLPAAALWEARGTETTDHHRRKRSCLNYVRMTGGNFGSPQEDKMDFAGHTLRRERQRTLPGSGLRTTLPTTNGAQLASQCPGGPPLPPACWWEHLAG